MTETHRVKLRNCIRKDTYRYYLSDANSEYAWMKLQEVFGKAQKWGDIDIFVIENEKFIMRKAENENAFTLIRKKMFSSEDEAVIHLIVKFNE